jgi:valyl-tRNA synthetase
MTAPSAGESRYSLPDRPSLDGIEQRWAARWEQDGTYRFDPSAPRDAVFSIDTPPPTVSGTLHIGHVFSYTQTDVIARFQRMRGRAVFYPIGFDDNGLPTERRVQAHYGVRCEPSLAYQPGFEPPGPGAPAPVSISRPNFVELCQALTAEDEQSFTALFRRLGLSVDWDYHYTTIGRTAQLSAQRSFLRLLARGQLYRRAAPTLWDIDFKSAIAQAELQDREVAGAMHRLRFERRSRGAVEIETTRPELLPSCVALVAHPDDPRYADLIGSEVLSPLFGVAVPVLGHRLAEPDKGTGIAMVCTFGDLTDITWWRELGLPTRTIIGRDGRLEPVRFGSPQWPSTEPVAAQAAYDELVHLTPARARRRIVELTRANGSLVGEPRPITHAVKFYERGERPLEIVTSPQWYIATTPIRDTLLRAANELEWHPSYMQGRYESWVSGLNGDWNISRQRYYGVPFPVWYRLDDEGTPIEDEPLLAEPDQLPLDPTTAAPAGYAESERGRPGGFIADSDVMDTWATSSLTAEIATRYEEDPELFGRIAPMDLRPQGHDIIRTWLFTTVVRAELEHGRVPFRHAAISGFVLDPDRKKMGKSTGNAVTPIAFLETHGTDAVRYWAAAQRLGVDTALDLQQMKVGRRLAIKLLNASRFALASAPANLGTKAPGPLDALDRALLVELAAVVRDATAALESYDHALALERIEQFFWRFCDDYLELVKARSYGSSGDAGALSAQRTLVAATDVYLRLFAPFLPFVTEEIWSWWQAGSVHRSPWPSPDPLEELVAGNGDRGLLIDAAQVLKVVRSAKSAAHRSLRTEVSSCVVTGPPQRIELLEQARHDLVQSGSLERLELVADDRASAITTSVELDTTPADQAAKGVPT